MIFQLFVGLGATFLFASLMLMGFPKFLPSDNPPTNDRMTGLGIIFLFFAVSLLFAAIVLKVFFA